MESDKSPDAQLTQLLALGGVRPAHQSLLQEEALKLASVHPDASLPHAQGVNAKVVSEMLWHAFITITLNTYSHVSPDMQDTAAEAMEAALGTG